MSKLEYLAAGSTLVNGGTSYPQLANCFVMEMQDDIEHIAKTTRDVMWLTKGTGGIGLAVTKLRAQGSPIRSNNTTSTGPIPFMHTIDSVLARSEPRRQEVWSTVFLHGELAPGLPRVPRPSPELW
jgi:ribonucleoside-diphosphate reductase alpha chain